jgi:hypothetical protein
LGRLIKMWKPSGFLDLTTTVDAELAFQQFSNRVL